MTKLGKVGERLELYAHVPSITVQCLNLKLTIITIKDVNNDTIKTRLDASPFSVMNNKKSKELRRLLTGLGLIQKSKIQQL